MAALLREGDFDLNGYVIGGDKTRPVYAVGLDTGMVSHRDQDQLNPHGDDRYFGDDELEGPTWTLELRTGRNVSTQIALGSLGAVTRAWRAAPRGAGQESTLRYMAGGRVRRVYGRPRNFTFDPTLLYSHGYVSAGAQFVTADTLQYDDVEESLRVGLVPGNAGGLVSPLISPLTTVAGGQRQGIVNIEGDAPAPLLITIKGPVSNPRVSSTGWQIGLDMVLAYDQSVTIDTRRRTVKRNDGADMSGALTRATFLPEARLRPGDREIVFAGTDATGTATCTVAWRPAYYGF